MSERETLLQNCISEPADRTAKLVLADWCEENSEPLAALALRWMAKHGKDPSVFTRGRWEWLSCGFDDTDPRMFPPARRKRAKRMPHVACWLPEVVGRELSSRYPRSSRSWFVLVKRTGWALQRVRDLVC